VFFLVGTDKNNKICRILCSKCYGERKTETGTGNTRRGFLFYGLLFIGVLGGGKLWHLQKFLQYIKYITLEFTLPSFSFTHPPPSFLE
jgi:hypothetical protein